LWLIPCCVDVDVRLEWRLDLLSRADCYAPPPATLRFTDNRLYAAYRIMLGGSFADAQAKQLLARCCDAPETPSDAVTSWNDLRKRVAGVPPAQDIRYAAYRRRPEDMQLFDVSCFPNAYRNSAATLRARIADHGANSPLVRDWVIG
jgi:hypothetical protein